MPAFKHRKFKFHQLIFLTRKVLSPSISAFWGGVFVGRLFLLRIICSVKFPPPLLGKPSGWQKGGGGGGGEGLLGGGGGMGMDAWA